MEHAKDNSWKEVGIVSDDATGIAALVCIQEGKQIPLTSIQLGTLIGADKKFSPHLHPKITWKDGKGMISDVDSVVAIPPSLSRKIAILLTPHLVEVGHDAIRDLLKYELVTIEDGSAVEVSLRCLSCS